MIKIKPEGGDSRGKGHNSKVKAGPVNAERLKSFVERIEKLAEEIKAIQGDVRDVYAEAKGVGYDVGTMRKVVRLRGMDAADRAEQETLLEVYWHALQQPDRIDARLAAGESQREVAKAEGVSKSTVQRRGPKVEAAPATSEMDHIDDRQPHGDSATVAGETQEYNAGPDADARSTSNNAPQAERTDEPPATPDFNGGVGTGTNSESCGDGESRPVPCGAPSKRSDAPPATAIGEAGVAPGPQDTPAEPQTLYQRITGAFAEPRKLPVTDEAAADAMEAAHEHLESLKRSKGVSP